VSIATELTARRKLPERNLLPTDEAQLAKSFSAVILPYDRGTVARSAKRSKDAVKLWRAGENNPSLWSALNMANDPNTPAVRNWLLGMLGVTDERDAVPAEVSAAVVEALKILRQKDSGA
jgi:hypothetical protein